MPKKPTKNDRAMLEGMLFLARSYNAKLKDIEHGIAEILGVTPDADFGDDYFGHVSDAVYSDYSVPELLKKLDAARKLKRGKK